VRSGGFGTRGRERVCVCCGVVWCSWDIVGVGRFQSEEIVC